MSVPSGTTSCAGTAHTISPGCSVNCLRSLLSAQSVNPLRYNTGTATVADVARLCRQHQLGDIRNLGPRRISEIRAVLILAGFDMTDAAPRPGRPAARRAVTRLAEPGGGLPPPGTPARPHRA
jgi:hypothetical protein